MNYKINENHNMKIEGTPQELKELIFQISKHMDSGASYRMNKEKIDDLEHLAEPARFDIGLYHTFYFGGESVRYVARYSSQVDINSFESFHDAFYKVLPIVNRKFSKQQNKK